MKAQRVVKGALITLALPAGMFCLMMIITRLCGVTYYGGSGMWRTIFTKLMYTMPMAYGISMQLRNGRMDFSGGATMVLGCNRRFLRCPACFFRQPHHDAGLLRPRPLSLSAW